LTLLKHHVVAKNSGQPECRRSGRIHRIRTTRKGQKQQKGGQECVYQTGEWEWNHGIILQSGSGLASPFKACLKRWRRISWLMSSRGYKPDESPWHRPTLCNLSRNPAVRINCQASMMLDPYYEDKN
jgi:hypothetical protein